jgi:hypothetical protein
MDGLWPEAYTCVYVCMVCVCVCVYGISRYCWPEAYTCVYVWMGFMYGVTAVGQKLTHACMCGVCVRDFSLLLARSVHVCMCGVCVR